jgi:hypothetical protein
MTKAELDERLNKEPFEPFRVNTSDGKHYDVTNPRMTVAMQTRLFIAFPDEGHTLLALRQVTSIGSIPRGGNGRGRSRKRRGA